VLQLIKKEELWAGASIEEALTSREVPGLECRYAVVTADISAGESSALCIQWTGDP
jgi:hypothetical protein